MTDREERAKLALKDDKSMHLVRRLVRESVRPYFGYLVIAVAAMGIVAAMTAVLAKLMEPMVDDVFKAENPDMLWMVGSGVIAVFTIRSLATYAQEVLVGYVGQRIIADTQNRLFGHLLHQDVALFQDRNSGTLISHFTYDINAMRNAVSNALVGLGRETLSVIFLVGVMFYQDWLLALIVLVVAPLTVIPVNGLGRKMRRVSTQTQQEMGALTMSLSQSFLGIRIIKAFGMEDHERSKLGRTVDAILKLTFRAVKVRAAVQPAIDFLGGIAIAAVIIYGGHRVMTHETTAGAFFSFITAVMLAYQPIRGLGKVHVSLQEGLAAAQRVFALIDRVPAIRESGHPVSLPREAGAVHFEDVHFSYDGEKAALNGVSFEAPAGKVTALVGPSGAGKSTVFNLIPRFHEPQRGRVLVCGHDVREISFRSLRDALAVVGQEVVLFDDTVLNNIRYGRWNTTDDEVHEAAKAAAADEFVHALPDGYDTYVGEQGLRLSGGQRQRIAIARAILKNAPILLLDEATSALDTESERQIQSALDHLMRGRTTIVIAHRLSTIKHADVIHAFDRGRIVESGTHEALLARDGLYARLHALQFATEKSHEAAPAEA